MREETLHSWPGIWQFPTKKYSAESQAAFGTIFRITGGFRNNFYSHRRLPESRNKRRGLLEEYSELVSDFQKSSINFGINFLHKRQPNIGKLSYFIQKYWFDFEDPNKNLHLVTLSFQVYSSMIENEFCRVPAACSTGQNGAEHWRIGECWSSAQGSVRSVASYQ